MGLKYLIEKAEFDGLSEGVKGLYKADGTRYVLDVDGAVAKDRLDEFRNNNIELQQRLDKLKDIDPAKYKELMDLDQKVKEKKLLDAGQIDEVVKLRVAGIREELEGKVKESVDKLSQADAQLAVLLIDNVIKSAAIKNGVTSTAVDDVVLRAHSVFRMENGNAVPKDSKGQILYGKDGVTPMTADEWLIGLKKTAPHLFVGSRGSGAAGGTGTAGVDLSKMTPAQKIAHGLSTIGPSQSAGPTS